MRTDAPERIALLVVACLTIVGCGRSGGTFSETSGPEALARLPEEVAAIVPPDAVLCLDDSRSDAYRLWLLRRADGTWLETPKSRNVKPKDHPESHEMPPSALLGILRSKLPGLDPGRPTEPHCRFTHWRLEDGAEVQIRELITDRGWFASVERVAM